MAVYEKFIDWCESQDKVHVDESEYLESMMDGADYLISDPSSVLEMWQVTGKPYKVI